MRSRVLLISLLIGMGLGALIGVLVGAATWFSSNPSVDEVMIAIDEQMNLDEEETQIVREMTVVGSAIDFGINLLIHALPAALIGGILGLIAGLLRSRSEVGRPETGRN